MELVKKKMHYYKIIKDGKTYKFETCLTVEEMERDPRIDVVIETSESAYLCSNCEYWCG